MTTYHFTLSKNKTRKRQKAINLLVCFDRTTRRIIPTKIHVLENQWDKADERVIRHSGRRYSTSSWRISGKRCRRTSPDNLPDAHRGQAGERIHGHEPRGGQKVDAPPHDIRRNDTGSPPRIPRKMDTAMTYIHLAEQDNRKALAGIRW